MYQRKLEDQQKQNEQLTRATLKDSWERHSAVRLLSSVAFSLGATAMTDAVGCS